MNAIEITPEEVTAPTIKIADRKLYIPIQWGHSTFRMSRETGEVTQIVGNCLPDSTIIHNGFASLLPQPGYLYVTALRRKSAVPKFIRLMEFVMQSQIDGRPTKKECRHMYQKLTYKPIPGTETPPSATFCVFCYALKPVESPKTEDDGNSI